MKVDLDDDATVAAMTMASPLGMSVASYVNWLVKSAKEANISQIATIKVDPQPPIEGKPRFVRYRKNWVAKF